MNKEINGMSVIRSKVIEFMENNPVLDKLIGLDWYKVENHLVQFICQQCNVDESTGRLFSKCNEFEANDHPTVFEEKIYRKVEEYYHHQDVLSVIEDDNDYRKENDLKPYMLNTEQLEILAGDFEDNLEYDGHMDIARETLENFKKDNHIV